MLVFGHNCDNCGYVGRAVALNEDYVGCPQCGVIEDNNYDIDTPDYSNELEGELIGV